MFSDDAEEGDGGDFEFVEDLGDVRGGFGVGGDNEGEFGVDEEVLGEEVGLVDVG